MLLISAVAWFPTIRVQADISELWVAADALLGVGAFVLVFFRRRWPLPVALTLGLVSAVSGAASGPAVLAAVSLATRRRWREIALVGVVSFTASEFYSTVTATDDDPRWLILTVNAVATAAALGGGRYIGSRREPML